MLVIAVIGTLIVSCTLGTDVNIRTVDGVENNKLLSDYGYHANSTKELYFQAKGCQDAQLHLLSKSKNTSEPYYRIVIGGWQNNVSTFHKVSGIWYFDRTYIEYGILDCNQFKAFWVSWEKGKIQLGKGNVKNTHVIFSDEDPCPFSVQDIEIQTNWGVTLDWIISIPGSAATEVKKSTTERFYILNSCPTFSVTKTVLVPTIYSCLLNCLRVNGCSGTRFDDHSGICELVTDVAVSPVEETYYRIKP